MSGVPIQQNVASVLTEKTVVSTAGIGMFLSTLDTGIINVALPSLIQELHSNVSAISWAVTLYLMALSGMIVVFGRLSDRIGRIKIYTAGLLVFALGSLLCGFAQSTLQLLVFRMVQGIGAAMMQATAAALVTTFVTPERRGVALGTLGMMIGLGPILGPTVGGFLLSFGGWRWIFWINLPFCLIGLLGCRKLGASAQEQSKTIALDLPGNMLFTLAALLLLLGISLWPGHGITNLLVDGPLVLAVLAAVAFAWHERRIAHPVVDMRWFLRPAFRASFLATMAFAASTAIVFLVPPYFFEGVLHLPPWQVGLFTLSAPLGLVILSRISGGYMKRFGTTRLMISGLCVLVVALAGLSGMQATWWPISIALLLFLYGMGGGLFQPSNIGAVMGALPKEYQGTIGAVQRMVHNMSMAVGASIASALMDMTTERDVQTAMSGFRQSWLVAGAFLLVSLCVFWTVRNRE